MSKRTPYTFAEPTDGAALYWRSLEEKERINDPSLYAERAAEFTPEQLERPTVDRRGFLGIMGAMLALVGAEGCRRPVEKIVPYAKMPEEVIPGVPTHYASVYRRRGDTLGVLVTSHEGRPTKVEGNPDHPFSLGATDLLTQASVLDVYDPSRIKTPIKDGAEATWEDFDGEIATKLRGFEADGGARLRLLVEPTSSPSFLRLRAALKRRFPQARIHTYSAGFESSAREAARVAFGQPVQPLYAYDKAAVILSLDSDFLQTEPGNVRAMRLFANGRRLRRPTDTMSRLYVVEAAYTTTGANADHRLRVAASQVQAVAAAIAGALAGQGVDLGEVGGAVRNPAPAGVDAKWIAAVAKELAANRGRSIVVPGSGQPAAVHALAHALNQALGNVGTTVQYVAPADRDEGTLSGDQPVSHVADLKALVDAMNAGQVDTLVMFGGNPVYDAPADFKFAEALGKVGTRIHLADAWDETGAECNWCLPRAHAYEAWGDDAALDGTLAVQQPLIAPLHKSRSDLEVLALLAGSAETKGYDIVRATFREVAPTAMGSDHAWRRVLRDGVVVNSAASPVEGLALRGADIAGALGRAAAAPAPTGSALEAVFVLDNKIHDGRYANNAWLQELPDPLTKIVWDNAALFSKKTAEALGIEGGDLVRVSVEGRSVEIAAWILPGTADNVVVLPLGWGRKRAGRVGNGKGFDVYPLRASTALRFASGVTVQKTGSRYRITQTQTHDSMENRPIAREATYAHYKEAPNFALLEAPPPRLLPLWREVDYRGHKWGMSVDLNACTGCGACVVACQAENNIAVVGKDQVERGRELHWLRIDRYFLGDEDAPKVAFQPLACVQCEEAPCENVCPVNATAHSPEGLNDMAYNRCIGTRYCANNCPYKVRRFNYLDFKGEFWDGEVPETVKMVHNPNVTVRMRGVMEKCTYCVQRIQSAKIGAKRAEKPLRDGTFTTACAQACPADAIVFGDLNEPGSRIGQLSMLDRRYQLLAEIGTQPRTSYLAKVRNPNSEVEG
jgi:molybdopterin-containing oxidoreductase family iron-sulfur binding subunit